MSEKLIARIESFGSGGYLAYIESIKGMVEEANTPEQAMRELLISLKVKMAYDLGLDISALKESVIIPLEEYCIERTKIDEFGFEEKEIKLNFSFS